MPKRTTLILDDDTYARLVTESVRRYGTAKAVSKVVNEELRGALSGQRRVMELAGSKKLAKISTKEFEASRKELAERFER